MSKRTTRKPVTDPSKPESQRPAAPRRRAATPTSEAAAARPRVRKNTAAPGGARPQPTHDQIAIRAYYIALERGFSDDPTNCWLRAERELSGASA